MEVSGGKRASTRGIRERVVVEDNALTSFYEEFVGKESKEQVRALNFVADLKNFPFIWAASIKTETLH